MKINFYMLYVSFVYFIYFSKIIQNTKIKNYSIVGKGSLGNLGNLENIILL